MLAEYYIVVNDQQQGPFSKEELKANHLSPDTLVWRSGMPDWIKASSLPELADLFLIDENINVSQEDINADNGWYAMIAGTRVGPTTINSLISQGLRNDTPVWHNGLQDWVPASTQAEIAQALNINRPPHYNSFTGQGMQGQYPDFSQNPQYGPQPNNHNNQYGNYQSAQNPNFANNPQYNTQQQPGQNQFGNNSYNRQPYNVNTRMNWLPWAIGATIVGFIFSCVGAIFGIIAIVQANKANGFYAAGYDTQADAANNTAKIMTIIGYVLAGIGCVTTAVWWKAGSALSLLNGF